jgi:hypothetical protein
MSDADFRWALYVFAFVVVPALLLMTAIGALLYSAWQWWRS